MEQRAPRHQNGSGCRPHKKSAPVHVHLLTRHGRRRLAPQRASAEGTDERRVIFSGPRGVHTVALDARNSSCALARGISHGNPGATEVQKATKELKNCGARLQTASGVSGTGRPGEYSTGPRIDVVVVYILGARGQAGKQRRRAHTRLVGTSCAAACQDEACPRNGAEGPHPPPP
ncbi:unnamed protein product, partial [Prorocentrum cordatum]